MIGLPFTVPSAPDWTIDWKGIFDSPCGGFLERMRKVAQNPRWHGEGDVLAHTQLVCESMAGSPAFRALDEESRTVIFTAALLHDVGKIATTRLEDGAWTSPKHSEVGSRMARKLLWQDLDMAGTEEKRRFREAVCTLVRFHSVPLHFLSRHDPERLLQSIAAEGCIVEGFTIERLALLAQADFLGRRADDLPHLMDELSLFVATARELDCLDHPPVFTDPYSRFAWLSGKTRFTNQQLFDGTWGKVYMMCALPGTGKDTWIGRNLPDLPVVSLDAIRREIGVGWEDKQAPVMALAMERARQLLRRKQSFVWNATSLVPDFRRRQLELFRDYGAFTEIVVLETSWKEGLRRNKDRSAVVPEGVIDEMLGRFSPPSVREAHEISWLTT